MNIPNKLKYEVREDSSINYVFSLISFIEIPKLNKRESEIYTPTLPSVSHWETWFFFLKWLYFQSLYAVSFLFSISRSEVYQYIWEKRWRYSLSQNTFTICQYWPYSRAWTPDSEALNFTMLVKEFMDIITRQYFFFLSNVVVDKIIFENFAFLLHIWDRLWRHGAGRRHEFQNCPTIGMLHCKMVTIGHVVFKKNLKL